MEHFIELKFPVFGKIIPSDHGYLLYSAISRIIPEVHSSDNVVICGISGIPDRQRDLHLNPTSKLRIRLGHSLIPHLIKLAGKKVNLGEYQISFGIPLTSLLKPKPNLYSRLVVIKGKMEEKDFLDSATKQLYELGIDKRPILFRDYSYDSIGKVIRKTLRVKDKEIVGFPIVVAGLSGEESLILQEKGLGGRKKMGCGSFVGMSNEDINDLKNQNKLIGDYKSE